MPKLAANIDFLFTEWAFADRFQAARDAGFTAVEILFPYAHDPDVITTGFARTGLKAALINMPVGDVSSGDLGLACLPERQDEFDQGVIAAEQLAVAVDTPTLHVVAGIGNPEDPAQTETYIRNVQQAADRMSTHGINISLEPINQRDRPGFFLLDNDHAARLMEKIDRPNVFLQFDFYHTQLTNGDLGGQWDRHAARTGHIQIANPPDRHEPGVGEVDYDHILKRIDDAGYRGWVSLEYVPSSDTLSSIKWAQSYLGGDK